MRRSDALRAPPCQTNAKRRRCASAKWRKAFATKAGSAKTLASSALALKVAPRLRISGRGGGRDDFNALARHEAPIDGRRHSLTRPAPRRLRKIRGDARIGANGAVVEIEGVGDAQGIEPFRDELGLLLLERAGHIEVMPESQENRTRIGAADATQYARATRRDRNDRRRRRRGRPCRRALHSPARRRHRHWLPERLEKSR